MRYYASVCEFEDVLSVYFNIEADEVVVIGKKMEAINEKACMNGYNWESFLNHYLLINQPELLDGLELDSEAGTYVVMYENLDKAERLVGIINDLINNPDKIYSFLNVNGNDIVWC